MYSPMILGPRLIGKDLVDACIPSGLKNLRDPGLQPQTKLGLEDRMDIHLRTSLDLLHWYANPKKKHFTSSFGFTLPLLIAP